jgi:hypothetical protein
MGASMRITSKGRVISPQAKREQAGRLGSGFLIGYALLTRDPLRYRGYFAKLEVIAPA